MENIKIIEFNKERDLGAIISDTFNFLRQNWKLYFSTIIRITFPVFLMSVVVLGFYLIALADVSKSVDGEANPLAFLKKIMSWVSIMSVVYVMLYSLLTMSTLFFIRSYRESNGKPDYFEIKQKVYKEVWKYLGLGVLISIVTIMGTFLCYIPGIYFMIVLSLAMPIMAFENKGIGDSFSDSFSLIKNNWWNTFGVLIVVWLIIIGINMVFSVPTFIYQFVKIGSFVGQSEPTAVFEIFKDPVYISLYIVSYIIQFLLYSIPLIAVSFIYFDLKNQKSEEINNLIN